MSKTKKILKVLKDGPAHCYLVSDLTDIDPDLCSSFLSQLFRTGKICRDKKVKHCDYIYKCWEYYIEGN